MSASSGAQREFRPPVRSATARLAIAAVIGLVLLVAAVPLFLLAGGPAQVTYEIAQHALRIDSGSRMTGERAFPLALVRERRIVTLHGGRRTNGAAMPGYCAGRFSYPDLGAVWQATDCSLHAVVLRVDSEELPIVVTPPDPEAWVQALDAGASSRVALPPPSALLSRIVPGGAALLAVGVGVMVVLTIAGGPGRMRYRVGEGRLEVLTIFGRKSWPLSGLRARAHTPKVGLRLAGTAAPGYYTGLYRADGQTTRIYATELSRGVLIEGPGRVFVSPEDREGFLDALRAAGATVEGVAAPGHLG